MATVAWRRAVAGLLCIGLTCMGSAVARADTLQSYQQQEHQVNQNLSASQAQYQAASAAWQAAHERVQALDGALGAEAQRLSQLVKQVGTARVAVGVRRQAAARANRREVRSQVRADHATLALYLQGNVSVLDVLLGADGFGDFLTRAEFLARIWGQDVQFLRQARADRLQATQAAAAARVALTRVQDLETRAAAYNQTLQGQLADAQAARAAEAAAANQAQAAVQRLLAEKAGLDAAIAQLLAQLKSGQLSWTQLTALVDQIAARFGIDPRLVEAIVIQESGGNASARSGAGALGLMQLMPSTAAGLGVSDPLDPTQNLVGGITYLMQLLQRFNGNLALALAAYNAGPGAVEKYGGIPPYAETQRYVQDVLSLYHQALNGGGTP